MTTEERKQRFIDAYVASRSASHASLVCSGVVKKPSRMQQENYFLRLKNEADFAWKAYANYMDLPSITELVEEFAEDN